MLCLVPILLTAVIYPILPSKPFTGGPTSTWLISPLTQDLLFAGFLYRWSSIHFPGNVSQKLPAKRRIFPTALYFSLGHPPGFRYDVGPVLWFQLVYTFFGACSVGIVCQWTGSLLHITIVHMSVNFITVRF